MTNLLLPQLIASSISHPTGNRAATPLLLFAVLATAAVAPAALPRAAFARDTPAQYAAPRDAAAADKAMRAALAEGSAEKVTILLTGGADVNAADENGVTPLMHASALGRTDLVELLVQKAADVNARDKNNKTALHYVLAGKEAVAAPAKKKRGFGGLVSQAKGIGGKALTRIAQAGPLASFLPGGALLQTLAQGMMAAQGWSGALGSALTARQNDPSALYSALDTLRNTSGTGAASALTTVLTAARAQNANALQSLGTLKGATAEEQNLWGAYLFAVQSGDANAIFGLTENPAFAPVLAKAAAQIEAVAAQIPGRDGGASIVRCLLARGADPTVADSSGQTAFARAKSAKLEAIAALLETGTLGGGQSDQGKTSTASGTTSTTHP